MSAKKRAPSIVEEVVPEDVSKPLQACYQSFCTNSTTCEFEERLLNVLDEIVLGDKNERYFVAVLKSIGLSACTDENDPIGLAIANVLWLRGTQVNATTDATQWSKLCTVTKDVSNSGLVAINLLKTTLDFTLLSDSKVVREDSNGLQKKIIRVNTGLVYKQQKYNLFREETEGYSKIVTTLTNSLPQYPQDCSACVANVLSIIGQFDLDPSRVLDVILDVFEQSPLNLSFVTLLKHFKHSNIVYLLGYKFNYYLGKYLEEVSVASTTTAAAAAVADTSATAGDKKATSTAAGSAAAGAKAADTSSSVSSTAAGGLKKSESKVQVTSSVAATATTAAPAVPPAADDKTLDNPMRRPTAAPASLYALAATLIMNDLVAIDQLAEYLQPSLEVTKTVTETLEKELQKAVKSYGVVNLNASATSASAATSTAAATAAPSSSVRVRDISAAPVSNDVTKEVVRPASLALKAATAAAEKAKTAEVKEVPVLLGSSEYDDLLKLFQELECIKSTTPYAQGNQFIGLVAALIRLRGWKQARYILNLLEDQGAVEVVRYSPDLRSALIDLTLFSTDAVYRQVSLHQKQLNGAGVAKKASFSALFDLPSFPQEQLQPVTSLNQFPTEVMPLLSYLGYHVSENPTLYARLCRLSQAYLKMKCPFTAGSGDVSSDVVALSEPIIAILNSVLLPGLTVCSDPNPFLASQVWLVVSQLPFQTRFEIYDAWKGAGTGKDALLSKPTSIALAETKTLHTARADLKRLAKENTKSVGLKLSRVTHCCPIVVYSHVLSTIEVFDNLIQYVVDALKFSTELARDCMAYCLIAQLKREHGGKLKKGDTHYSSWFSALSRFIANYYCKYSATELKGLLHYLLQVLSNGESLDLLVLKELLCVMGSCDTLLEVSQVQLEGLSGGRALRSEVMGTGNRSATITANAAKKAMTALRDELISSNTALPLLLFIAQIRCQILYDASSTQLKLISHLFDIAQDVLMQFTDFLVAAGAKTLQHIAVLMPPLNVLLDEIGLVIPVAFQLVRPICRSALQFSEEHGDGATLPHYLKAWHPFSEGILSIIKPAVEGSVWRHITPSLYVLFWSLSYYDIDTPTSRYQMETKRIKDKHSDLENRKYTTSMTNPATNLNYTTSEVSKLNKTRESDMKQLLATIATLNDEMAKQQQHVALISNLIANQKEGFCVDPAKLIEELQANKVVTEPEEEASTAVPSETELIQTTTEVILQELIFHRVLMSPIDAIYCVKFLLLLHQQETPHFSFLYCVDQMISTLAPLIFSTTEVEASFIGYALNELLAILNKWVASKTLYQAECQSKLGASYSVEHLLPVAVADKLREAAKVAAAAAESEGIVQEEGERVSVTHEMFLELSKVWHTKLFTIIIASLNGKEYMYVRSALILLSKINSQFPTRAVEGRKIIVRVEVLQDEEKNREDLQTMAKSLSTMLKRTVWIDEKPVKKRVKTAAPIVLDELNKRDITSDGGPAGGGTVSAKAADVGRSSTTGGTTGRGDDRGASAAGDRLRDGNNNSSSRSGPSAASGSRDGGRDSGRDSGRDVGGRDDRRDDRDRDNRGTSGRESNLNSRESRSNLYAAGGGGGGSASTSMANSRDNKSSRDLRESLSLPPLGANDSRRGGGGGGDGKDARDAKSGGVAAAPSSSSGSNDAAISGQKRKASEADVRDKDGKDRKSRSNSRGRPPLPSGPVGSSNNAGPSSVSSGSSGVKRSHDTMNNESNRRDNRDSNTSRPSNASGTNSSNNNSSSSAAASGGSNASRDDRNRVSSSTSSDGASNKDKVERVQRATSAPNMTSESSKKDEKSKNSSSNSNGGGGTDVTKDANNKAGNKESASKEKEKEGKNSSSGHKSAKESTAASADSVKSVGNEDSKKESKSSSDSADRAAALAAADPASTSEDQHHKKKRSRAEASSSSAASSPPPKETAATSGGSGTTAATAATPAVAAGGASKDKEGKSPRPSGGNSSSSGGESKTNKSTSGSTKTADNKAGVSAAAPPSDVKPNPFTQPPPPNEPPPRIFQNRHYQADRGNGPPVPGGGPSYTNTPTPFPAQQQQQHHQDQGGRGGYSDRRGGEEWRNNSDYRGNDGYDGRQQYQQGGSRGGGLNSGRSSSNQPSNNSGNNSRKR